MVQIIDEEKSLNMTTKFNLGQEVVLTSYQGYRKGVVTGISINTNDKGTVILYSVELYVGKKSAPKVKKCLEKHLYNTVRDALAALSAMEESKKQPETTNKKSNPETKED